LHFWHHNYCYNIYILSLYLSDLKSVKGYSKEYASLLGDKQFFHGDTAGVIDCSIYGVLNPFKKADNEAFHDFLDGDEIVRNWYKRMDTK
jgi:glutathione S-transferase